MAPASTVIDPPTWSARTVGKRTMWPRNIHHKKTPTHRKHTQPRHQDDEFSSDSKVKSMPPSSLLCLSADWRLNFFVQNLKTSQFLETLYQR